MLVATRSAGKLRELWPMVEAAGFQPVTLDHAGVAPSLEEDAIEAFDTFEENAHAKARHFSARSGGLAVLADDSGLAVEALGGAPGVRSKRWASAGRDARVPPAPRAPHPTTAAGSDLALDATNNRALLEALEGAANRRAKYVCVAVIAWRGGEVSARGEVAGRMLREGRGVRGFGYDPLFFSDELAKTFGEATREEKSRVSHRARAVRAVLAEYARSTRGGSGSSGRQPDQPPRSGQSSEERLRSDHEERGDNAKGVEQGDT